ncbi:MAG TPA: acetaldehyde dehydrogenase (acetylating) [Anaerovoracaceae bacterium]|nr:acetaldehyde dehydrogenase (acetylating) [Anaerovoracaceae bacterium]
MSLEDKDLISIQEARNLAKKAKEAQKIVSEFDEKQIDSILRSMVKAASENAARLAEMAVSETGFGKIADKTFKNEFASTILYDYIKDMKTIGIIREDTEKKLIEIAEPMGVLMGIIPSTNPTSTIIFKSIIALKTRNGIVFSPHPSAVVCSMEAAKLMAEAAVSAGAPEGIIGCMSKLSMEGTDALMHAPEIALILATGGSAMVKSSYSSGKPALGVGPGNVPAYIEKTADIEKAVRNIIASKTFDNGTICASEQSVIVETGDRDQVIAEFTKQGAYFMSPEETAIVSKSLFTNSLGMNQQLMGRSPQEIARKTGITIPEGTTVLIGEQKGVGREYPLSYEKLTTVLAFYTVEDWKEACDLCIKLLHNGGIGHSISIHTEDREMVLKFATKPVFRILVNTPSSQGGVGASTALAPSFTLGSGTWGGSSTSDNVTPMHLINIKRIAYGIKDVTAQQPNTIVKSGGAVTSEQISSIVSEILRRIEESGGING